jgi:hypothetical protein
LRRRGHLRSEFARLPTAVQIGGDDFPVRCV